MGHKLTRVDCFLTESNKLGRIGKTQESEAR